MRRARESRPGTLGLRITMVVAGLCVPAMRAGAQRPARGERSVPIVGRVMDERQKPIDGASVAVDGTFWRATTTADGRFRIALPRGHWTLRIRRLGYQPASIDMTSGDDTGRDTVRITLTSAPGELRGVIVTGDRAPPLASTIAAETVRQLPPVGEPDIMRLLPMLPSVSQSNDLIGRLHLAGGASDENGTYLDGHPLQAPFHVLSVLGAFDVASLDHADVLIHHLPASMDGRLSGAVDLRTRRAGAKATRDVDVGLLSASVTATQPSLIHGVCLLASARMTYLDRIIGSYARATGASDDLALPSFRDGVVTLRKQFAGGWSAELLGYGTLDTWGIDRKPNVIPPRWSEGLLGATASYDGPRWRFTLRQSVDRAAVRFQEPTDIYTSSGVQRVLDYIDVKQRLTSSAVELRRTARRWSAAAGATLDARDHDDRWSSEHAASWFSPHMPQRYAATARQRLWGAFGESSLISATGRSLTAGAHVSVLDGRAYVAPRIAAVAPLSRAVRLELAADRRHQFDAVAEEPREGSITQPVFLLEHPRVADQLTISGTWEHAPPAVDEAPGRRGGVQLALYARRDRDRTVLDAPQPTPAGVPRAPVDTLVDFPLFQRVPGRTMGASLSGHVVFAGHAVVQGSYTLQRVRERVSDVWRPTEWDAPQTVNVFAGVPIAGAWTLTSALQLHSGMAITPVAMRLFQPDATLGGYEPRYVYGAPYSARLPAYRRLDLGARRTWTARGAEWTASFEVLNVLASTNPLERDWRRYFACVGRPGCDEFRFARKGLPVLPSIGLQVRW